MIDRYIVAECSRCHTLLIADSRYKSKTCHRCNARIPINELKVIKTAVAKMSSTAGRKFMEELSNLLQKHVSIVTSQGKTYVGTLTGVDTEHLSVCLTNAKGEQGDIHKLFINGSVILQISSFEKPFDLQSLGERLERVFPRMVRVMDDAGVILVMDRIRVNEKGIIEGSGPAAERVQRVFDEFIREKGLKVA